MNTIVIGSLCRDLYFIFSARLIWVFYIFWNLEFVFHTLPPSEIKSPVIHFWTSKLRGPLSFGHNPYSESDESKHLSLGLWLWWNKYIQCEKIKQWTLNLAWRECKVWAVIEGIFIQLFQQLPYIMRIHVYLLNLGYWKSQKIK